MDLILIIEKKIILQLDSGKETFMTEYNLHMVGSINFSLVVLYSSRLKENHHTYFTMTKVHSSSPCFYPTKTG